MHSSLEHHLQPRTHIEARFVVARLTAGLTSAGWSMASSTPSSEAICVMVTLYDFGASGSPPSSVQSSTLLGVIHTVRDHVERENGII